ncbi:class I SAM-dependent methyltransferase [Nocardioides hankookensis]|uniref:Class I SAM-dependent methyltransferase n=1 Tax=Nocardioides hankookensis TaxID=443157 RepID=A0ABW1LKL4_9ACTN
MGADAFPAVFGVADAIPGWLTRDQAHALFDAATQLRPGSTVVEIGSHQGRSTVVLAGARPDVTVVSIDPFVGGKYGGDLAARAFARHVDDAGVADRVESIPQPSETARRAWGDRPVDLLYVDGAHDPVHAYQDIRWARTMAPGSRVLVHDSFSSVGVTLALAWAVARREPLVYDRRVGSLAVFTVGRPGLGSAARMLRELPWFLRNVVVKTLMRLRLRPVARFLGHRDAAEPY